jgi:hypothetical protein
MASVAPYFGNVIGKATDALLIRADIYAGVILIRT